MHLSRRSLLLFVFCIANLFAGSLYSWSVFSGPLAAKLSIGAAAPLSAADLGFIFSIAAGINPVAMISGGWVNDRFGPKYVLTAGGLMIGAGLALSALAPSLTVLAAVYGLLFGFGVGLMYVSTLGTAMRLFPDRKGFAGGLVTMSYGLSSMFVPLIASALIEALGITTTLLLFGAACGVVICAAGLFSGAAASPAVREEIAAALAAGAAQTSRDGAEAGARRARRVKDKNWREMLASPVFYPMLLLFICGSTAALMLISSAAMISVTQIGLSAQAAAGCVAALAVANTAGRFTGGAVSDRIGRLPTLGLSLLAAMAGLAALFTAGPGDVTLFLAGLVLAAACYGSFVGVFPGLTVETFGLKYNSVNYGIMAAGFSSAGVLGPAILKTLSTPEGFTNAYLAAEAVCASGLILLFVCRRMKAGEGGRVN